MRWNVLRFWLQSIATLALTPSPIQLKKEYKENHGELKSVQSDITYCQKLVDQARQRLVQEFDMWYLESFVQLGDQTRPSTTTAPLTAMAPSPSPQTVSLPDVWVTDQYK